MQKNQDAIQIENLKFKWKGSSHNLLDIPKLHVPKSKKIFLQGSSGSGKTTLLNLISGVLDFSQGDITIFGQKLKSMSHSERDSFRGDHMGFVFQLFNLLPFLSVYENIVLPLEFSKVKNAKVKNREEETKRLLNALELDPAQYLNRKVTDLSVGQQQRVAVARALIGNPELLIADEPTSSLDHDVRDQFLKLLFKECESHGTTVLFVSHDPTLRPMFDEVISLKGLK
jgi:putative ABC transport system ATP-binding protein